MSYVPSELRFTNTHEWIRDEGDGVYTIGLTDHAQSLLGDMVFVDLPEIDAATDVGEECAVAESVKAASDIYAPLTGIVVETNEDLEGSPELVNSDPYGDGWLFKLKCDDEGELDELLDAERYQDLISDSE
ncbi:glycine cleavage system protein GcvH [Photobacterium sanguinicancri]|uniref:Glycine cleavage system H protein n=1 Tax=Photobacterium sanguinicancri TaxID=875932 RepID=A0AAW7Y9E8_9GAMM|nr:glycine cleavage system protein GcvH [Photobacterium sanguinicancri]KXI21002.1 glycine cleavage system protein H [Photobacterium sanguinicancri]MDO6544169.1 glycine cleavage system protein GcvH [Photobacterium sanguinicancri]OZS43351.1 glycine cleavage system protein H [Photobacterium sanguinicancri]